MIVIIAGNEQEARKVDSDLQLSDAHYATKPEHFCGAHNVSFIFCGSYKELDNIEALKIAARESITGSIGCILFEG